MDFADALGNLKFGMRLTRADWTKGTWVALGGTPVTLEAKKFWNTHTRAFAEKNGGSAVVAPYFVHKNHKDEIQMGFTFSQADILADDWEIV